MLTSGAQAPASVTTIFQSSLCFGQQFIVTDGQRTDSIMEAAHCLKMSLRDQTELYKGVK